MESPLIGADNGTRPKPQVVTAAPVTALPAAEAAPAKRTRRSPTDEQAAEIRKLRAEGVTFKDVAARTGFSVGTVQKLTKDPAKPTKVKGAKRGPKPKAKVMDVVVEMVMDTPTAVKVALFDLLSAGHPVAAIRGAIASLHF